MAHIEPVDPQLVLRSLNLLAREFTKYNHAFHRNGAGQEAHWQTRQRYLLSSAGLLASGADVICLQECAPGFFDPAVNPLAAALAEQFERFEAFGPGGTPGAAVLVRARGGRVARVSGLKPLRIRDEQRAFGGLCYSGCAVPVRLLAEPEGAPPVWVVSVHSSMHAQQRAALLEAVGQALGGAPRVVLAGDLNARDPKHEAGAWIQGLDRVASPAPTGLSGDFSRIVQLDHVLVKGLEGLVPQLFTLQRPAPPYRRAVTAGGRGAVVGGSDHVALDVVFHDRAARVRALDGIYHRACRPPAWAVEWAASPAFLAAAREAAIYSLDPRAEDVWAVACEREPVNIGMHGSYDADALAGVFGWQTSGYQRLYAQSEAAGRPELPPNLAVFCRTPVEGPDGPQVDVLNVTGFAFDSGAQVDHRYFVVGGRLAELRPRLRDVWSLVFACARQRRRETVVLALVGAGAFCSGFPGGASVYLRDHLFPALAEAWAALPEGTRPARVGLMGRPAASGLDALAAACPGAEHFGCGYVPGVLTEQPDALFVNAWDPHSVVGNGNAADASLDGYFGRSTAMQFLSLPAINPFLKVFSATELGSG